MKKKCFISFTDSIQHARVTVQIEAAQQLKQRLNTGNLSPGVVTLLKVNFRASFEKLHHEHSLASQRTRVACPSITATGLIRSLLLRKRSQILIIITLKSKCKKVFLPHCFHES